MNTPLIYILVLNYKGVTDTEECIDALIKTQYDNYKIVLIDNDSQDGSEERLREKYEKMGITILQTGSNLGYAKANNIGIRLSLEAGAKYTCILNNDVIVSADCLSKMVESMENNSNIAMEGPMILDYKEDIVQSTGAMINFKKGECVLNNFRKDLSEINREEIVCDYVEGACLLVRNSIISDIGFIPEDYFLFFEETEWCWKCKLKNYDVVCNTHAWVRHKGSASMDNIVGIKEYYLNKNRVLFEKRNATVLQKICFLLYLTVQTLYRISFKKYSTKIIQHYIEGWTGRNQNQI